MQEDKKEDKKEKGYIPTGVEDETIRFCPFCNIPTELASGCNYLTCPCKGGFNLRGEWCWVCRLPKYQADPNQPDTGFCNDKTHNSH